MIFDAFLFMNEMELLDLRLHELSEVVDRFVLVESTCTFSGSRKPLYYAEARERFAAFDSRIAHVVVDDTPATDDPWVRQAYQRNAILRGLDGCASSDLVLISDLDEIPRACKVREIGTGLNAFEQTLYYYYLNVACVTTPIWHGTVGMRRSELTTPQEARDARNAAPRVIADGGWHFSYLGGPEAVLQKVKSLSAQEYNIPLYTDIDYIRACLGEGRDFLGRDLQWRTVEIDETYPRYLLQNLAARAPLIFDRAARPAVDATVPMTRYVGMVSDAQKQMDLVLRRVRSLERTLADRDQDLADARTSLLALQVSGRPVAALPDARGHSADAVGRPDAGDYDRTFYENRHALTTGSAQRVLQLMRVILPRLESAVDVGCGVGTWLSVLMQMGVADVCGLDGDWVPADCLKVPAERLVRCDLRTAPPDLGRTFDLAISLEVAEHLPASSAGQFVATLAGLSDFVLFSAAVPGQGGTGHVNERWPDYWIGLFEQRGFACVDVIRRRVAQDPEVLLWYRRNTLLFVKADRVGELETLGPMTDYIPAERCVCVETPATIAVQPGIPPELGARIRLEVLDVPERVACGTEFQVRAKIASPPGARLSSRLEHPIHLSYHWQDARTGTRVVHDGRRAVIEPPLEGGGERVVAARVLAPDVAGSFVLQVRLVQEGIRWFEETPATDRVVEVRPLASGGATSDEEGPGRPTFAQFGVHTIFVEISTVCNMRCAFCPIDHTDRRGRRMDYATFTRVIDQIAELSPPEAICLNVLGEPLLHPDVFRFIDYCASRSVRVYLFTNGTLDQEDLGQICERDNIEALVLSYQTPDAGSYALRRSGLSFEQYRSRVLGAVDFVFAAGAYRKMRVEIHLANTKHLPFRDWDVLTTNEQAVAVVRELGAEIRRLCVQRGCVPAGSSPEVFGDSPDTIPANLLDLREWDYWGFRAAPNTFVRIKYMGTFGAVQGFLPAGLTVRERTTPVHCDMLKEALCVLADGRITNCCLDVNGEMAFGHIETDTILDALRSRGRRRSIEDPTTNAACRRCAGEIVRTAIEPEGEQS